MPKTKRPVMKYYMVAEMNDRDGRVNDELFTCDDKTEAFEWMGGFMADQDLVVNAAVLEFRLHGELARIEVSEEDDAPK